MGHSSYINIIIIISVFRTVAPTAVKGFVGGSADLLCSIPEGEIQDKMEQINVHWRDDEGKTVCDIIGGIRTDEHQASEYKNRVETFPEEYKKGNFSIKLIAFQKGNEMRYICHITGAFQYETIIELQAEDKPRGRGSHGEQHGELTLIVSLLITFFLPAILQV